MKIFLSKSLNKINTQGYVSSIDSLTPRVTKASQFKKMIKNTVFSFVAEALEKARGHLTTTPRVSAHQAWARRFGGERVNRILVPVVSGQTLGCWPEPWLCEWLQLGSAPSHRG